MTTPPADMPPRYVPDGISKRQLAFKWIEFYRDSHEGEMPSQGKLAQISGLCRPTAVGYWREYMRRQARKKPDEVIQRAQQ